MLGLVLGPGEVLGVGLVVLGVSVPMPPAEESVDESPDVPLEESEGMPEVPVLDPPVPTLEPSVGSVELTPLPPVDVPALGFAGEVSRFSVLVVPPMLVPELPLIPGSEVPPVMPAQAPSNSVQAIGNIHFVINYSRKFRKAGRTAART